MRVIYSATLAGSAALVATAPTSLSSEAVTITDFAYRGNNEVPEIRFSLSATDVSCYVADYTVPGEGYTCTEPAYTFDVLAEHGAMLRLYHSVNGSTLAGDFTIRMNGPLPTILDQVGTSSSTLVLVGS
ncbi:hypothetical protein F4778DRAFT_206534 [Xylariomycetidae sp. FL2044]|nr:hypothetical protein F4778DRAFT_206534 [Xylariomycetidae sp. FL2044]